MSQQVVLSLGAGDLCNGFPAVTAHIREANQPPIQFVGGLPAAPELSELYHSWRLLYEALNERLEWHPRMEVDAADITNISYSEFAEQCQQLIARMNAWLNSELFCPLDQPLRAHLSPTKEIRLLIETNDLFIQRLPWHSWNFLEHYPKAEIAVSAPAYQRVPASDPPSSSDKIRILAVFGDSKDLDLRQDQALLKQLHDQAEIEFLIEPQRHQLNDQLWQHHWDILFFAGHSSSQAGGLIRINSTECLTLDQLHYALRQAIDKGLKLAVFNSCDGLGLAQQLADLNIPQIVVMREPVPDVVAHHFLQYFLKAFSGGESLYRAVRKARERLQGLEGKYPCATWLPIICQNPAVSQTNWHDWRNQNTPDPPKQNTPELPEHSSSFKQQLRKWLLASVGISTIVVGIRWLGFLQPWELSAFDLLMRSRPNESQDQRILIVTLTEEDFQLPEQRQRQGSLADTALIGLLDKLEPHQPRAIGLDIYREPSIMPALAQRLRRNKRFFAICRGRESDGNHPGIASLAEVPKAQQGFSDVLRDPDGILRRHLLAMQPNPASPCTTPYAFSAQLAFHYLEAEKIFAHYTPDKTLQIGNVLLPRLQFHQGGYQRTDPAAGYQILLNYRFSPSPLKIAPTVTLKDVLMGKVKPEQIKDRIVLIGVTAQSFHDYLPTPYSAGQGTYQEMPGVIMQAQMLSQLLSAVKDQRSLIKPWPLWGDMVWIWVWAGISGAIVLAWSSRLYRLIAIGGTIGVSSTLCWILFLQGAWVPWVPTVLVIVGTTGTIWLWQLSSRSHSDCSRV